ncbi:MAG: tail fiber domain-containing protein, partial [bacterium]|nr:tail fiber domain-containing protein [bacterium]
LGDGDITPLSVGAVAPSVITAGGATTGQILEYDGLNWIPVAQSTATVSDGTSILGDGDITPLSVGAVAPSVITAGGATTGQILEYDGLNWIPVTSNTLITANEIPRGDGAGQVSSNLFSDGTNIGLGQATPVSTFHIATDNHIISEMGDLIISDNIHLVGGNPTYTENGRAVLMAISSTGGDVQFFEAPTGVSGNTASITNTFTINGTGALSYGSFQANEGITVAGNLTTAQLLSLGDADNSALISFRAPDVMASPSVTFTLPDGDGTANQVLTTDGAGVLSWQNNDGFVNSFEIPKGTGSGLTSSDIYSNGTNQITIGSPTAIAGVKFAVHNQGSPLFMGLTNYSNTATDGSNIGILRARGTEGGEATLQTGDVIGSVGFNVWDGSSTHITSASIRATATSNHTFSTDYGTQLSISTTADGQGVDSERIRIQNDGSIVLYDNTSVGNGPTSAVKLQITPDAGQNNAFRINPESGGTNTGEFQMMELSVNGTNFVGLKAADNIANTRVYTWPDADGTPGQFLTTDGAGIMSWTSAGSFNTANEIPRGDGAGLVSSNIFSDGANISMGSNQLSLPINLSVIQEGSGNAVAGVATFSSSTPDDASSLALIKARGTEASPVNNLSGDRIGTISFTSRVNGAFGDAASIEVFATEPHATSQGADFTIRTAANGETSVVDRIQIDGNGDVNIVNGNLGVGIAPLYAVDVQGDINVSGSILSGGSPIVGVDNVNNNVATGAGANASITTGSNNTAIGDNALNTNASGIGNTAVGAEAGTLATGGENTFIGRNAGNATTGNNNVFVGSGAGQNVAAVTGLTLVGYNAGQSNTAINTVLMGYQAGINNQGANNTFIGYNSGGLSAGITGSANTALGGNTAANLTTGVQNTFLGYNAGNAVTTGARNTFVGMGAAAVNDGSDNVAIGRNAASTMTGNSNIVIGSGSSTTLTTGGSNVIIGATSGTSLASVTTSVGIGANAQVNGNNSIAIGEASTAGNANSIAIGQGAQANGSGGIAIGAGNSAQGARSVVIGDGVSTSVDDAVVIGGAFDKFVGINIDPTVDFHVHNNTTNTSLKVTNSTTGALGTDGFQLSVGGTSTSFLNRENTRMDFGNNGTTDLTIGPAGNVGISEVTPVFTLDIAHDNAVASGGLSLKNLGGGENVSLFVNNASSDLEFHANNGATILGRILNATGAYEQLSDRRAKKNFESTGSVLADINKVNITKYHYKRQDDSEIKQIGVVAQELKEIFPSLVSYDEQKDVYTVNYAGLAPVTVKAIQELNALILAQKDEIEILRSQIASKDVQLNKLENDVSAIKAALGLDNKTSEK